MGVHTVTFHANRDRLGTCRFCGEPINPTAKDIRIHQVAEYRFDAWSEAAHEACDDAMPAASNLVPDGYRRYKCIVVSPQQIIVLYDIGLSDIGATIVNYKALNLKLSVIRNARCIYFQNMLQVDIPEALAERYIYQPTPSGSIYLNN
jgi:hypothetical protein